MQNKILSLPQLTGRAQQPLANSTKRQLTSSIPGLDQVQRREQLLQNLHRWRKGSKAMKLQQTYDENCRIFMSLRSQQSQYRLAKNMPKKHSYLKLAPLTGRVKTYGDEAEGRSARCQAPKAELQSSVGLR